MKEGANKPVRMVTEDREEGGNKHTLRHNSRHSQWGKLSSIMEYGTSKRLIH